VPVFRICRQHRRSYPAGTRCPECYDPKAWANSGRRKGLRKLVFARQGGRCGAEIDGVRCPSPAIELHHIIARSKGGSDDPSNAVGLCLSCHAKMGRT